MVVADPSQRADLDLELPAAPQSVGPVRDAVTMLARDRGFSAAAIGALAVAVSEAASNVVVHAYHDQPAPGLLRVCAGMDDGELSVVVSDDGPGVRPRIDSPGLGLGMPLIAALARHFEVGIDRAGRNCVRMRFGSEQRTPARRPPGRFRRLAEEPPSGGLPAAGS
jgi:serine/threonine-protein kinase RsbW